MNCSISTQNNISELPPLSPIFLDATRGLFVHPESSRWLYE